MALTNATTLADYGSGIGTQGATLKVDANNQRVGIGTLTPAETLDVVGNMAVEGDISVTGTLSYEDLTNVDAIGYSTFRSGINVQGAGSTTTTLNVIGVSTFANSVVVGGATTALLVNGDTRIVGILTVGSASVTFSGVNNRIAGVTTFVDPAIFESSIDVDGHTELDNLNVSGVSTFVGIVTSQSNVFVGNNISVAGNARVVGVLTVGSSSITLDGSTNKITVGSGVTIDGNTGIISATTLYGNGANLTGISVNRFLAVGTRVGLVTVTAFAGILTVFGRTSDTNILV